MKLGSGYAQLCLMRDEEGREKQANNKTKQQSKPKAVTFLK